MPNQDFFGSVRFLDLFALRFMFISWDGDIASVEFRGLNNPNHIWEKKVREKLEMHRTYHIGAIVQPCEKGDLIMPAIFFIRHLLNGEMQDTNASIPRMFWSPTE